MLTVFGDDLERYYFLPILAFAFGIANYAATSTRLVLDPQKRSAAETEAILAKEQSSQTIRR